MNKTFFMTALLSVSLFAAGSAQASRIMSVSYGTITGINQQARDTSRGTTGGALLGGVAGLATGRGRSRSNQALRTLGGAAVGSAAGRTMARGTEMVYTVNLLSGGTVRVVMDSGNFHRGDCVTVEQGGGVSANMRRVSGEFCSNNAAVPQQYIAEQQREADQCAQAKRRLLDATTEEEVNTAAMVMNILCQD
jgi:outer membrane lipoprotein SlyB